MDATNVYLSTREAADRLGYSRPDSLMRAWRSRDLPVYQTATGYYRLALADVERFLRLATAG